MKGPYERLKYDLRRLWECPACKRRERTSGAVTFRFCPCGVKQEGGKPVVMQLIADGPQRLVPPIAAARGECAEKAATTHDTPVQIASEPEAIAVDRDTSAESSATGTGFGPG
jgi:hypothetical protein